MALNGTRYHYILTLKLGGNTVTGEGVITLSGETRQEVYQKIRREIESMGHMTPKAAQVLFFSLEPMSLPVVE